MSTVDVAGGADGNDQSAQDVQDMLAELKESNKATTEAESATAETNKAVQNDSTQKSGNQFETHDVEEQNNGKEPESEKQNGINEKKKDDGNQNEGEERSRGYRGRGNGARGRGGGRGRGNFKSYKQNVKSDLTAQEETDDPVQIRRQVEFYFSDSNLPMDKFLLSQVGGSKNLPVDLKVIHSFKRMRHFQPFSAIPVALKESNFLELTDDDTKVRRKEPLPDKISPETMDPDSIKVFEDRAMPRSVYVKGFGEEDSKTQLDIEAFFEPHGPVNAIRLRRANDMFFKGSVFVEFDSEETQKKFLDLDPKPKYKGKDLQIMSKKAYCEKKVDDIKSGKVKPGRKEYSRGRGDHHHKRKRDNEDDRDWRDRREDDRKIGFRDSRRGGSGGGRGGGRDSKHGKGREMRKDVRGVPIVETTVEPTKDDNSRAQREAATADALAKAKAMVEAENANKTKPEEDENRTESDSKPAEPGIDDPSVAPTGKKRGRDEETEAEDLPEAKKLDIQVEEQKGEQLVES